MVSNLLMDDMKPIKKRNQTTIHKNINAPKKFIFSNSSRLDIYQQFPVYNNNIYKYINICLLLF